MLVQFTVVNRKDIDVCVYVSFVFEKCDHNVLGQLLDDYDIRLRPDFGGS